MSSLFGRRVEEVAKELGVSVRTARRYLVKYAIPHSVMPGRYKNRPGYRISDDNVEILKRRLVADQINERDRPDKGIGRHSIKKPPRTLNTRKLADRKVEG